MKTRKRYNDIMKYVKVKEEELKNTVARDFFGKFDHTKIIGEIDFAVKSRGKNQPDCYFLWAEAKAAQTDICDMLTQLVLTIPKWAVFNTISAPPQKCPPLFRVIMPPSNERLKLQIGLPRKPQLLTIHDDFRSDTVSNIVNKNHSLLTGFE